MSILNIFRGLTGLNILNDRGSLNMYNSGESLMRMSPPSLVSSMLMENSGNFNQESLDSRKSLSSHRDSGIIINFILKMSTKSLLHYFFRQNYYR